MSRRDLLASALEKLPHGPEFRFVDRLSELQPGESATGHYLVRGDESFLAGHFPGNPVVPGVILIEAIAQLGGVVVQCDPARRPLANLRLTAVRSAKVFIAVQPGTRLDLRAEVEGRMGGLVQVSGQVSDGDEILATAKVVLSGEEDVYPNVS